MSGLCGPSSCPFFICLCCHLHCLCFLWVHLNFVRFLTHDYFVRFNSILQTSSLFWFDLIPFFNPQDYLSFPLFPQVSTICCPWCFHFPCKCLRPSIFHSWVLVFRPSLPIFCRLLTALFPSLDVPAFFVAGWLSCVCVCVR